MMKTLAAVLVYCILSTAVCLSQDFNPPAPSAPKADKGPFWSWDKVYFGGGLGGGFTQYETALDLSPIMGYKVTPKFSVGIGGVYNYYENRFYSPTFKINIYGGCLFTRYIITDFLFLHAEYQPLNGPWIYPSNKRFFIHNVWLGGGLRQAVGDHSSFMVTVLWNVNENIYSYPLSPQIRMGFNVGL